MSFMKKSAVAAAAVSLAIAPVAASAQNADFDGLRADSEVAGFAMGEAGGSWIIYLLAGAAIIAGIVVAADGTSNAPTSP